MTCGEGACSRWTAKQAFFWGRFATQREQAPSPQCVLLKQLSEFKRLSSYQ